MRPRHLVHLSRARRSPTPQAARYTGAGLRDRPPRHAPTATTGRPTSLDAFFDDQLDGAGTSQLPEPPRADDEPHALHRLERLRRRSPRSSWRTASGSTRTTTTGRRDWVQDRPGLFTGSGMPMRFADADGIDDRRLPGDDPDDRRVGADLPVHDRHAARSTRSARGLLRRLHGQHAHRQRAHRDGSDAIVASAQARGVPVVSARQMLDMARRPQRRRVRHDRLERRHAELHRRVGATARTACRRCCRRTRRAAARLDHARRQPRRLHAADGQGHRVRVLPRRRRRSTPRAIRCPATPTATAGRHPPDCNDHNAAVFPERRAVRRPRQRLQRHDRRPLPRRRRACTAGVGACAATGVRVCTGEGTSTVCNAIPGTPTPERCDGSTTTATDRWTRPSPISATPARSAAGTCSRTGVKVCTGDGSGTTCSVTPAARRPRCATASTTTATAQIDDGNPGGGGGCATGQLGVCGAGTRQCQSGALVVRPQRRPDRRRLQRPRRRLRRAGRRASATRAASCTRAASATARARGAKVCLANGVAARTCGASAGSTGAPRSATASTTTATAQIDEGNPGGGGELQHRPAGRLRAGDDAVPERRRSRASRNVQPEPPRPATASTTTATARSTRATGGGAAAPPGCPACARPAPASVRAASCSASPTRPLPRCATAWTTTATARSTTATRAAAPRAPRASGVCAAGTMHCQGGALDCVRNVAPSTELCGPARQGLQRRDRRAGVRRLPARQQRIGGRRRP